MFRAARFVVYLVNEFMGWVLFSSSASSAGDGRNALAFATTRINQDNLFMNTHLYQHQFHHFARVEISNPRVLYTPASTANILHRSPPLYKKKETTRVKKGSFIKRHDGEVPNGRRKKLYATITPNT